MIDSHCHFDFDAFESRHALVLKECQQKGVQGLLVPGIGADTWSRQQHLQQCFAGHIDLAFGLHPYFLHHQREDALDRLDALLSDASSGAVAVGEFGLDYSTPVLEKTPKEKQIAIFAAQLDLAKHHKLPVILHHRKSHNDIIRLLKQHRFDHGGVIHAFSGSTQEAMAYLELGFCLGIGGTVTYPRGQRTRRVVANLAPEGLLLETDAPDMPLQGFQGKANSPTQLPLVAQTVAALRNTSVEAIGQLSEDNYLRLFRRTRLKIR